jgi:hypothetical protein
MNNRKIDSFFKRKTYEIEREERDEEIIIPTSESEIVLENPTIEEHHGFENSLERDPGKRPPIWQYPPNQVDAICNTHFSTPKYLTYNQSK